MVGVGGITIEHGKALGRDYTLADLTARYDAVFLAMLISVPALTMLATFVMIGGGYLLATAVVGIEPGLYLERTANALQMKDFSTGLVKSVFFALVICWVGVYRGFQVEGGAEGVGRMTTSSVVTSIFWIVVVDMMFTVFFYFL